MMRVDIREHVTVREDVKTGLKALLVQGRQIWGTDRRHVLYEIVVRLMVGVGDIARLARDNTMCERHLDSDGDFSSWRCHQCGTINDPGRLACKGCRHECCGDKRELKKELGNVLFSTIRWIDDLGLDPLECLDLAIEAQEKFAKSGRPR